MSVVRNPRTHRASSTRTSSREKLLADREQARLLPDAKERSTALRRIRSRLHQLDQRSPVGE